MRKPWIALIVSALLLGLLGVGCGGSDDNGQEGSATSAGSNGAASETTEGSGVDGGSDGSESEAESGEAEEPVEDGESSEDGESDEGGEAGEGSAAEESAENTEPGTKEAFVAEAEQICLDHRKQLNREIVVAYNKQVKEGWTEAKLVNKVVLPSLEGRQEEIEALSLPGEDEAGAQAVVDAMAKTNQDLKAKPTTEIPSDEADKLAREYGIPTCSLGWL